MPFNIIRADITTVAVDAVVNAANESLLGGSGVDGAIHKAAGKQLLEECKTLGGCKTGEAKITRGYNMPCKYIIHTVGPIWRTGNDHEKIQLYSCYKNSLELAVKYKCESVAFPLISSGAYGCPKATALEIARKAILKFLETHELDVTLVVFDRESFSVSSKVGTEIESLIDDLYAEEHFPAHEAKEMSELNRICTAPYVPEKEKRRKPEYPSAISMSSIAGRLDKQNITFSGRLMQMIDERSLKDSDVYKAANISKQLFSKIRSDKNYHPQKNTVLAFAVALKLTLAETDELLKYAGYILTTNDRTDIIVSYFIEKHRYNIYEINEVLFKYDLTLLGRK
ncbi:MAG: macro domain-containing protein [Oscillospiraceae bacterium]|nr:macro domain-containing protein [Oscillospiraceae bacterium]